MEEVRQTKQLLDGMQIVNRYDAMTLRVLGQAKIGSDPVIFSMRSQKALFLESRAGESFGMHAPPATRLVDISEAKSGFDVEAAIEAACKRLNGKAQKRISVLVTPPPTPAAVKPPVVAPAKTASPSKAPAIAPPPFATS